MKKTKRLWFTNVKRINGIWKKYLPKIKRKITIYAYYVVYRTSKGDIGGAQIERSSPIKYNYQIKELSGTIEDLGVDGQVVVTNFKLLRKDERLVE